MLRIPRAVISTFTGAVLAFVTHPSEEATLLAELMMLPLHVLVAKQLQIGERVAVEWETVSINPVVVLCGVHLDAFDILASA